VNEAPELNTSIGRAPAAASTRLSSTTLMYAAWSVVVATALWYIWTWALRYLPSTSPASADVGAFRIHVGMGILALLLGPPQFILAVRRQTARWHRYLGRAYVAAIAVSVSAGIYIIVRHQHSLVFEMAVQALIMAWVLTTGLAFIAIRRRHFEQHREWMIRSYVVTFSFVVLRLGLNLLNALDIGPAAQRGDAMTWFSLTVPLLFAEVIMQGRKIFVTPSARVR
jgi:uncharacterized membrane protein